MHVGTSCRHNAVLNRQVLCLLAVVGALSVPEKLFTPHQTVLRRGTSILGCVWVCMWCGAVLCAVVFSFSPSLSNGALRTGAAERALGLNLTVNILDPHNPLFLLYILLLFSPGSKCANIATDVKVLSESNVSVQMGFALPSVSVCQSVFTQYAPQVDTHIRVHTCSALGPAFNHPSRLVHSNLCCHHRLSLQFRKKKK